VDSGGVRFRILSVGRREDPTNAVSSSSPVWIYDADGEQGIQGDLQVLALSLRQMAGSWVGLDSLRSQAQTLLSLQSCDRIGRAVAAFEADTADGDRVYYLVTQRPAATTLLQLLEKGLRPTEAQVTQPFTVLLL
jgi:hypothetical protein